jgi:DNA primase
MTKHYSADFLRMLRNQIPIDAVIGDLLKLQLQNNHQILRFRCPMCANFHTATNDQTNLARCFDCKTNFNPIDLVMTVTKCSFVDAVQLLKDRFDL